MTEFGECLKQHRLKTKDTDSSSSSYLTQAQLADLMSRTVPVDSRMISFWETGRRKIHYSERSTQLCLIQVLHKHGGIQTVDEANELLRLGRYDVLSAAEMQEINRAWAAPVAMAAPHAVHRPSWPMVYAWLDGVFRWSEADDHARMSWAGMVIWSLGVVNGRLSPDHFLAFLAACLLWIAAIWLLVPALQWPLTPQPVLQQAVVRLLAGWFGLPLLLALFTKADGMEQDQHPRLPLLLLKLTGAVVGFNLVVLLLLMVAAGWYYLLLPPLLWGWRLVVLLPLLLGHIAARRIPVDRLKMYQGELRAHAVDYWFFGMYLLTGLMVGAALFWGYRFWANPAVGTSFLLVMLGIVLWERQKKRPLSPLLLIILLGCAFPLLMAWLLLFVSPIGHVAINTPAAAIETGLGLAYVMSLWSLGLTLQLRTPSLSRQLPIGGLLLLAVGLSLYLLVWKLVPAWLNLLGFVVAAMGLIGWGYSQPPAEDTKPPAGGSPGG